jgi:hypothetical protein
MLSSREAVRCMVHDGAIWLHLDDASIRIPSHVLMKSRILLEALSVTDPSVKRKLSLPVPEEWLQAWAACYCDEEEKLSCLDINDLVHCLMVCFLAP